MSSSRGLEFTDLIDSANRDRRCYPDANNCVIPLHFSQTRLPVQQIVLGSMEIPISQYTVEEEWSHVYFSEQLELQVLSNTDTPLVEFSVELGDGTIYTAVLPPFSNPVVAVHIVSATTAIFTTQFENALDLRSQFTWGFPMMLANTFITDPTIVNLTASNPNLTIIDEFQFQLTNIPPSTPATIFGPIGTTVTGLLGLVTSPGIPSPRVLASLVTSALNLAADANLFTVTYNENTGAFSITAPANLPQPVSLLIPGANSLPAIMGFGSCASSVALTRATLPIEPDSKRTPNCGPLPLCGPGTPLSLNGGQYYQCQEYIQLTPCNYLGDGLAGEMELQFDRLWFDSGCAADPSMQTQFVFSDRCGVCHSIAIPYGKYQPRTLANYLTAQMNLADPTAGDSYLVSYIENQSQQCEATGVWNFSADVPFGLEFGEGQSTMYLRLGFNKTAYRGEIEYVSPKEMHIPVDGCCMTTIRQRTTRNIYRVNWDACARKINFHWMKARPVTGTVSAADATTFTITNPTYAHGFEIDDLLDLYLPGSNVTYTAQVVQVIDAFTYVVARGSIPAIPINTEVCAQLSGSEVFNLFNAPIPNTCRIKPFILGFDAQDYLWVPGTDTLFAPNQIVVDWPPYVLMVVSDPIGSTYIQHSNDKSNITTVFAKIILNTFSMQRIYPMAIVLQGIAIVKSISVQIRNPDHSLYHFHGRNWSATLIFQSPTQTAQLTCG